MHDEYDAVLETTSFDTDFLKHPACWNHRSRMTYAAFLKCVPNENNLKIVKVEKNSPLSQYICGFNAFDTILGNAILMNDYSRYLTNQHENVYDFDSMRFLCFFLSLLDVVESFILNETRIRQAANSSTLVQEAFRVAMGNTLFHLYENHNVFKETMNTYVCAIFQETCTHRIYLESRLRVGRSILLFGPLYTLIHSFVQSATIIQRHFRKYLRHKRQNVYRPLLT